MGYLGSADLDQAWLGPSFTFQIDPAGWVWHPIALWALVSPRVFFPGLKPKRSSYPQEAVLMVTAEMEENKQKYVMPL